MTVYSDWEEPGSSGTRPLSTAIARILSRAHPWPRSQQMDSHLNLAYSPMGSELGEFQEQRI